MTRLVVFAVLAVALTAAAGIAACRALREIGPLLDEMHDGPGWTEEEGD